MGNSEALGKQRSPSQEWFEDLISRWKPISKREAVQQEKEFEGGDYRVRMCVKPTCRRQVARGTSALALAAAKRELCLQCHKATTKRKVNPWSSHNQKRMAEVGPCVLCGISPISGGKSKTAKQAQALKLCSRCYCSGGASKLKERAHGAS